MHVVFAAEIVKWLPSLGKHIKVVQQL